MVVNCWKYPSKESTNANSRSTLEAIIKGSFRIVPAFKDYISIEEIPFPLRAPFREFQTREGFEAHYKSFRTVVKELDKNGPQIDDCLDLKVNFIKSLAPMLNARTTEETYKIQRPFVGETFPVLAQLNDRHTEFPLRCLMHKIKVLDLKKIPSEGEMTLFRKCCETDYELDLSLSYCSLPERGYFLSDFVIPDTKNVALVYDILNMPVLAPTSVGFLFGYKSLVALGCGRGLRLCLATFVLRDKFSCFKN